MPQNLKIIKLSNNKYYAKKGELYFGFEKITNDNIEFWKSYCNHQKKITEPFLYNYDSESVVVNIWATTQSFLNSFKYKENNDVWAVYITSKDLSNSETKLEFIDDADEPINDIEMCVTVMSNSQVPFSTHMGIFRAFEYSINAMIHCIRNNYKILDFSVNFNKEILDLAKGGKTAVDIKEHVLTLLKEEQDSTFKNMLNNYLTYNFPNLTKNFELSKLAFLKYVLTDYNKSISERKNCAEIYDEQIKQFSEDTEKYHKFKAHNGLAIKLHSFAAMAILEYYNNQPSNVKKDYMVTRPLPQMIKILKKAVSHEYIFHGKDFSEKQELMPSRLQDKTVSFTKLNGEKIAFEKPDFFDHGGIASLGVEDTIVINLQALSELVEFDIIDSSETHTLVESSDYLIREISGLTVTDQVLS